MSEYERGLEKALQSFVCNDCGSSAIDEPSCEDSNHWRMAIAQGLINCDNENCGEPATSGSYDEPRLCDFCSPKKKFKVTLSGSATAFTEVEIEAHNEQEARELASDGADGEWEYDGPYDIEVQDVEIA